MTLEERRAWSRMLVSVAAYAVYVTIIVNRADGRPLADVPYAATLLWTIGIAIAASIAFEIVIAITGEVVASVKESVQKEIGHRGPERRGKLAVDERDREIGRYGEYVGNSFVVIGATSAMLMAMVEWPWFWIANVIYLCFLLSQVLSSITKIVLYRRGLPQW